jgi:hypothetical protein
LTATTTGADSGNDSPAQLPERRGANQDSGNDRETQRGPPTTTEPKAASAIRQQFAKARKTLVQRADAPAPAKKARRTEDGDGDFVRKHTKRLFRKMKRRIGNDCRDLPPTFEATAWYRQQQSRIGGSNHEHHSPTRDGAAKPTAWTNPNHAPR